MPHAYSKDPLLTIARFLVGTIIGVFAFAGVIVAIGLGAILTCLLYTSPSPRDS